MCAFAHACCSCVFTSSHSASAVVSALATVLQQAARSGLQRCLSVCFLIPYSNPQGTEARRVERAEAEEEEEEEQGDN